MATSPLRCDVSHLPDWPDLLERATAIVASYDTLIDEFFDRSRYETVLQREADERQTLSRSRTKKGGA